MNLEFWSYTLKKPLGGPVSQLEDNIKYRNGNLDLIYIGFEREDLIPVAYHVNMTKQSTGGFAITTA
jgi:hypothetical protein